MIAAQRREVEPRIGALAEVWFITGALVARYARTRGLDPHGYYPITHTEEVANDPDLLLCQVMWGSQSLVFAMPRCSLRWCARGELPKAAG